MPTIVLLLVHALLVAAALGMHQVVRPGLLTIYEESGIDMSRATAVALGGWLLPGTVAVSVLGTAIGMLQKKRGLRLRYLGAAVGCISAIFMAVAWLAYGPLLR